MKKLIVLMLPVTVAILTIFQSPAQAQYGDHYGDHYDRHKEFAAELLREIDERHDYAEKEEMKEEIYRLRREEEQRRFENLRYPEPDSRQ
jgi:hypothetical protein